MKRLLTIVAAIAASACAAQAQDAIPNGAYAIQRVEGVAVPDGSQHSITIEDGTVTTFDGCNVTTGQANLSGGAITWTSPMQTTAADCPEGEIRITHDALARAKTWEIRGGSLLIADAAKNTIITARAQ